jgi:tungstate transport system substrate-binding protein
MARAHALAAAALLLPLLAGCTGPPESIILATTTSTKDSGLLEYLLPGFEALRHVQVKVVAVGTGRALELGRAGDADVVLVHAPATERAYLANGSYAARYEVMHNEFLLVGPPADPARLREAGNVSIAFARMAAEKAPFVSRGDASGTHLREQQLWALAGLDYATQVAVPANTWYRAVGQGMGATLRIAAEQQAYTLSDDSTFYATEPPGLAILRQDEPPLRNQYSVMLLNATRHPGIKADLAFAFAAWMVEPATQARIGAFEVKGHRLFTSNAGVVERGP